MLNGVAQDLRDSWRSVIGAPGVSLGVIGSLALGMAAVTAAFSLVNTVALRPPGGIHRSGELVELRVERMISGIFQTISTEETFPAIRGEVHTLTDVAAFRAIDMVIALPGEPLDVPAMVVSANYFDLLGVRPAAGRLFGSADDDARGTNAVAVLSYEAWVRHFDANPSIVGAPIKVNGRFLEVVGVAAPEFTGTRVEIDEDSAPRVWIPLSSRELVARADRPFLLRLVGRLRSGASRAEAQAEVSVLASSLPVPPQTDSMAPVTVTVTGLDETGGAAAELVAFMAVPAIVLLLASVNAANLLTSRASRRTRDAALRLSLGATTWRIVRQMLVESLVLALTAAASGVVFAIGIVALFEHYMPIQLYVDWRVLAFAAAIAVVTAFASGLAPAISAALRAADLVVRLARRPRSRMRSVLIGAQAALSLALIATGWQFANTVRTAALNDGLRAPERLTFASLDVGKLHWPDAEVNAYYDRLAERVKQLPGVTHVALSCACNPWGAWVPIERGGGAWLWLPARDPAKPVSTLAMYAGGDLFGAMELELAAGRAFRADELTLPIRSVVVNQPFADRYLGPAPIGQIVRIGGTRDLSTSRVAVIVGVVKPPQVRRTDTMPMIYYPAPFTPLPQRTLLVRFDRPADTAIASLHAAIREVHADVARPEIVTAEQLRWQRNSARQFMAAGVSFLGGLALVLAAVGLYGVVSFVVTLRRHEIAVRMALGANPRSVVRMVVRQALTPAGVGTIVGAGGAAAMSAIVRSRLYGASLVDPVAFGGATALLLAVLLIASAIPARHAARVDPMTVLKEE